MCRNQRIYCFDQLSLFSVLVRSRTAGRWRTACNTSRLLQTSLVGCERRKYFCDRAECLVYRVLKSEARKIVDSNMDLLDCLVECTIEIATEWGLIIEENVSGDHYSQANCTFHITTQDKKVCASIDAEVLTTVVSTYWWSQCLASSTELCALI